MPINDDQIKTLVKLIATVQPDQLDCDGCSEHIAEFAETQLLGKTVEESQKAIQTHLENCHCCQLEFQSLLEALQGLDEE